jgi:hypothetical protein
MSKDRMQSLELMFINKGGKKNLGDYESRMEDARMEVAIKKAIIRGDMGECDCGSITSHKGVDEVGEPYGWLCKRCQKREET